ncbi:DUF7847 domain-containing protein [Streptomyces hypolithicus]
MPPQPPPPKPGVIPLAPLVVGDILGGAFSAMGRHWKQLFGISVLVCAAAFAVVAAALAVAYGATQDSVDRVFDSGPYDDRIDTETVTSLVIAFAAVWIVAMLVMIVATATIQACCPAILQDAVLGRRSSIGAVWRRTRSRVPAVIGALLLPGLALTLVAGLFVASYVAAMVSLVSDDLSGGWAVLGIALTLTLMPAGVWLWVRYSLAPAVVVFESQRPVAALRRSALLVRGSWWRIFGVSLLGYVIASVASYFIQLPLTVIGMLTSMPDLTDLDPEAGAGETLAAMGSYLSFVLVGSIISHVIATTFPQLVTGLLYVDQRIRRENLAPALAEAAASAAAPH